MQIITQLCIIQYYFVFFNIFPGNKQKKDPSAADFYCGWGKSYSIFIDSAVAVHCSAVILVLAGEDGLPPDRLFHTKSIPKIPPTNTNAAEGSAALSLLLLTEGLAVGALIGSGVCLVGTHQNPVQAAVIGLITVVGALLNGAFDALVCMVIHSVSSFLSVIESV